MQEECISAIKGKVHPESEWSLMLFLWSLDTLIRVCENDVNLSENWTQVKQDLRLWWWWNHSWTPTSACLLIYKWKTFTWEFLFRLEFCSNSVATKVIYFHKLMEEMVWGSFFFFFLLSVTCSETSMLCCALRNAVSFIFPLTLWPTQYCSFNRTAFVEKSWFGLKAVSVLCTLGSRPLSTPLCRITVEIKCVIMVAFPFPVKKCVKNVFAVAYSKIL